MIGNGTGIAPFRSFWQQRMFDLNNRCPPESSKTGRRQWGDMLLFFGCRNPHLDDIYRDETEKAKQIRVITDVATAYSRQEGRPKVFIAFMESDDIILNTQFDWFKRKSKLSALWHPARERDFPQVQAAGKKNALCLAAKKILRFYLSDCSYQTHMVQVLYLYSLFFLYYLLF